MLQEELLLIIYAQNVLQPRYGYVTKYLEAYHTDNLPT